MRLRRRHARALGKHDPRAGALGVLIVTSFVLPGGSASHFQPLWPSASGGQLIGPFGVAMVAVLWAYDGWIETTYVGSEIVNPGRNLPRSIILSTLIVIALYVPASVAYAYEYDEPETGTAPASSA